MYLFLWERTGFSLGKFTAAGGPCPRGVPGPPIAAGRSLTSVHPPGKQCPGQPRHRPRAGERSRGGGLQNEIRAVWGGGSPGLHV